jgi:hypothetical protein
MSWNWNWNKVIVFTLCLVAMVIGGVTSSLHQQQQVKANWIGGFNCFGEKACVEGWNNGTRMAQIDWNQGAIGHSLNSGDLNCWITYSIAECHGYIHGYIHEWTQLWNKDHHSSQYPTNEDKELKRQ